MWRREGKKRGVVPVSYLYFIIPSQSAQSGQVQSSQTNNNIFEPEHLYFSTCRVACCVACCVWLISTHFSSLAGREEVGGFSLQAMSRPSSKSRDRKPSSGSRPSSTASRKSSAGSSRPATGSRDSGSSALLTLGDYTQVQADAESPELCLSIFAVNAFYFSSLVAGVMHTVLL